ncbi:DNA damage-inducible protein F [Rhodobacteraceae bacterium IMCC1933]|nr:DNA damage-inducible protein F [Rhodobacteraceae bacterium IMCC1923]MDP4066953.1 DNA damage-inducible protein F [Rhodobacteraceae bacterium IMCC1933]MDP4071980.1 DNA damage-inducible protein F [Rhodobacteraceae bacterium IMCC1909]
MADPTYGITHKRVLSIALPIVISNATVPILGAVDTGVIGQLGGAAPIGAVGIGAIILGALYWIFGFLRMGTVGLTSQALGGGDAQEVRALFFRSIGIGVLAGMAFITFQIPIFTGAFWIAPASAEVEDLARAYMSIRVWSAPAAIAIYGLSGWLIAQERTRAVLMVQLFMNVTNIILDFWFVLGLGFGVEGVAVATLIAEWGGLGLGLYLCRQVFRGLALSLWQQIVNRRRLIHMMQVNGDILIRSVLLQAGFVSFLFFGAELGDVTLAANQVLLQFVYLASYAMDGFVFAAESLVGQAMGARAVAQLRRGASVTAVWAFGSALVLAAGFWIVGPFVIDVMAKDPTVQEAARLYLPHMVAAPLLGALAWMLDGVFIGATRTQDMRNMMILSFLGYCGLVLLLLPSFGNHGLWMALNGFFILRGVSLAFRYPALERVAAAQ